MRVAEKSGIEARRCGRGLALFLSLMVLVGGEHQLAAATTGGASVSVTLWQTKKRLLPLIGYGGRRRATTTTRKLTGAKLERSLGVIRQGDPKRKQIALTFDDGPHGQRTERLLAILRKEKVPATFFVVGKQAEKMPELIGQMVAEGHEIGNHSYRHKRLIKMTLEEAKQDIEEANDAIQRAGNVRPVFFRPPGGRRNDDILRLVHALKMKTALWTINPGDSREDLSSADLQMHILKRAKNGAIILLHSGMEATMDALPAIIEDLKEQGYTFVTLSQMTRKREF